MNSQSACAIFIKSENGEIKIEEGKIEFFSLIETGQYNEK